MASAEAGVVVASNTSSLSITALGQVIGAPERTVGTHYLNPPLLMPPVEIIAGERTSDETVAFARDTVAALGSFRRRPPGRRGLRLESPAVRARARVRLARGAGRRDPRGRRRGRPRGLAQPLGQVGPLRSIALGGVETWNRAGENIVPELSTATRLRDLADMAIAGGDLAEEAARRDGALARELHDDQARSAESPSRSAPSSSHVSNE